jgi:16S rRNA (guanine1516-N2)-methyltransferase
MECGILLNSGIENGPREELSIFIDKLQMPVAEKIEDYPLCLLWAGEGWGLVSREFSKMNPLVINFSGKDWQRRLKETGKSGDILSKALKKIAGNLAIDSTAGLGRDTLHLLALGFQVVAIERHPLLVELLKIAHGRAMAQEDFRSLFSRLQIISGDATEYLDRCVLKLKKPDLVFIDPMFSREGKSALSGKEMQIVQVLMNPTPQEDVKLLIAALRATGDRVIVKRPVLAPPLMAGPRHSQKGKSVRYDIYFPGDKS